MRNRDHVARLGGREIPSLKPTMPIVEELLRLCRGEPILGASFPGRVANRNATREHSLGSRNEIPGVESRELFALDSSCSLQCVQPTLYREQASSGYPAVRLSNQAAQTEVSFLQLLKGHELRT